MKFASYAPPPALSPYIKQFIISENPLAQTYKVLPDTALVMGFQYSGKLAVQNGSAAIQLDKAGITGLLDHHRSFSNANNTGTVLVIFRETGAAHFLKTPLNELFNQSISLANFFNATELSITAEQLAAAGSDRQKIAVIAQLLSKNLHAITETRLVEQAINIITASKGIIRIAELAKTLNTSQSPLEKRFRKLVGASPKKFATIIRVKKVLEAIKNDDYKSAVFLSGYYDQSHFIKDFKTFTGETPSNYLEVFK